MTWPDIRQLRYAQEFRIPNSQWPLEQIGDVLSALLTGGTNGAQTAEDSAKLEDLVVQIGNAAWRLEQRIIDRSSGKPRDDYRKLSRHVDSISDALGAFHVEIQDHTHQPFVTGLALDVFAFEPIGSIEHEIVIETLAPSIYLNNKRLQRGKVIVGTPGT
jgi:hypothetical protein